MGKIITNVTFDLAQALHKFRKKTKKQRIEFKLIMPTMDIADALDKSDKEIPFAEKFGEKDKKFTIHIDGVTKLFVIKLDGQEF